MLQVTFEHSHDEHPEHTEGPFLWIECIGGIMAGLRPDAPNDEAEEIAGVNADGTWDAGERPEGQRNAYTRFTIVPVNENSETNDD